MIKANDSLRRALKLTLIATNPDLTMAEKRANELAMEEIAKGDNCPVILTDGETKVCQQ
jgi:hypothetical protein